MPFVTIIIPIYNTERYLSDCLTSIQRQTFTDWVCFLINDGSTDNCQLIIDDFCIKDSRFVALKKQNEKSIDLARKYGIEKASTEWILPVDSDDAIELDYIERLVSRQKETGADIVESRLIGCTNQLEGESYRVPLEGFDMNMVCSGRDACLMTIGGWTIPGNGNLYKRSLAETIFGGGIANSDELTYRKLLLTASTVAFSDAHYLYRSNNGSSSSISPQLFARVLVDLRLEQFLYDNFPERNDKIKAVAWQRLFNLIYLTGDYYIHKHEFSNNDQKEIEDILNKSFVSINRKTTMQVAPFHSCMLLFSFEFFSIIATRYVRYKRSHGGRYFYR